MWRKHYQQDAPNWKPFDHLMGVLSQIDNMLTGLVKAPAAVTYEQRATIQAAIDALMETDRDCDYPLIGKLEALLAATAFTGASAAPAPAGEGAQRQAIREAIRKVTGHPDLTSGSLSLLGEIIRALAQASPAQPSDGGCERGRGTPSECGSSPMCGCPAALAELERNSGVDAQWVERAMELARDCEREFADQAMGLRSRETYVAAREALCTHLSTALTGAAVQPPQESAAAARKDAERVPASDPWRCACGSALYIDAEGKPRSKAADGVTVARGETVSGQTLMQQRRKEPHEAR
jgi:hypothetical protein